MATVPAVNPTSAPDPRLVYPHIVKVPGYCGGKATIEDTRVRVVDVAFQHKCGKTVAEILAEYEYLTPAQVHAAIAYYYDHVDEIEATLAEDDKAEAEHEQKKAAYLSRKSAR